jgi:hypothetical protein
MVAGFNYYVHEGWRDGQFTVCLHRGDCIPLSCAVASGTDLSRTDAVQ